MLPLYETLNNIDDSVEGCGRMSDAYDLQDYPETPLSDAFALYVCGLVDHCNVSTMTKQSI